MRSARDTPTIEKALQNPKNAKSPEQVRQKIQTKYGKRYGQSTAKDTDKVRQKIRTKYGKSTAKDTDKVRQKIQTKYGKRYRQSTPKDTNNKPPTTHNRRHQKHHN